MQLLRQKRERAALKYKPRHVNLLLVAEAPPAAEDRYFYFESVASNDWLFVAVVEMLFGEKPSRSDKSAWLARLQRTGVFLIDLKLDPVDGSPLERHVPSLVSRCQFLRPERIVLIKATVYDAAYKPLKASRLPVVNKRVPFPSTGQQGKFRMQFAAALKECGMERERGTVR
jgi:hypothetical protein